VTDVPPVDSNTAVDGKPPQIGDAFAVYDDVLDPAEPVGGDQAEADRRPTFSIRSRITLSFGGFFLFCAIVIALEIYEVIAIQDQIGILEFTDDLLTEIQQARRMEKNFLLRGTNKDDALEHLHTYETLVARNSEVVDTTLGHAAQEHIARHVQAYRELLINVRSPADIPSQGAVVEGLRNEGAHLLSFSSAYVDRERRELARMLTWMRLVPFAFIALLMVLSVLASLFLTRQILRPLGRLMEHTRRIGSGDFTMIRPGKRYRDEFTTFAQALDRMVRELDHRHNILVQSHKLRAMGTLVAGVAHELNNPLNNVLICASILRDEYELIEEGEKLSMLDDIIRETKRSRKTVRHLLDFARESETQQEHLDLAELIDHATRLIQNQVRMSDIHLSVNLQPDLPPIDGDRQMLLQVFVNLVLNAVDALQPGGRIDIDAHVSRSDEGYVTVAVRDNGPGIPPHILSRIFDPFFTTKADGKGTGLGLSVSRGIVRKLGGYLRVQSKPGEGTEFSVLLPITEIPSEFSTAPTAEVERDEVDGGTG